MKLILDHTQRINLLEVQREMIAGQEGVVRNQRALLGAQRADVGPIRAIWPSKIGSRSMPTRRRRSHHGGGPRHPDWYAVNVDRRWWNLWFGCCSPRLAVKPNPDKIFGHVSDSKVEFRTTTVHVEEMVLHECAKYGAVGLARAPDGGSRPNNAQQSSPRTGLCRQTTAGRRHVICFQTLS